MLSHNSIAARALMGHILQLVHSERDPEAAPEAHGTQNSCRYPGNQSSLRVGGGGYISLAVLTHGGDRLWPESSGRVVDHSGGHRSTIGRRRDGTSLTKGGVHLPL